MHYRLSRRDVAALAVLLASAPRARAEEALRPWAAVESEARGQTVYFNAWAGSEPINAYIGWLAGEVERSHGIRLEHVKITDAAEVVRRVRDEVKAGIAEGSVDLVWINGENFRAMKEDRLLDGPFAADLPNFALVDTAGKPTTLIDFAEATEGLESPWGMAQLTFFGDGAAIGEPPPLSMAELLDRAAAAPGRITYPAPPDFHGTTFIKQALLETMSARELLATSIEKDAFAAAAGPLFAFLDRLHPLLWRQGRQFPQSQAQMTQMAADKELVMSFSFNPNEPVNLVAAGTMPPTTVAWQHAGGTIGNSHFVAIPINARAKAAARVVANVLLSPEAQARKADPAIWGDPTVLDLAKLAPAQRSAFVSAGHDLLRHAAPAVPEPHASWVPLLEAQWLERYGA